MMSTEKKHQGVTRKEVTHYLIFGLLTTLINWLVYALMVGYFSISIHVANVIAWVLATGFAFIANKIWVFHCLKWDRATLIKESSAFLGGRVASGSFEITALPIFIGAGINQPLFGIDGLVAKIGISTIVAIFNYVLSKWFIFKRQ